MSLSHRLDRTLGWLKWPAAVAAVVATVPAVLAVLSLLRQIAAAPAPLLPFLAGLGGYLLVWWLWLRRPIFGSFVSTMEHELTHALFAWLTLHRVTGIRATWRQGGHITFVGRGNWLITIAPYFFPTICLFVLVLSWVLPEPLRSMSDALLGAAMAYHITSTMRETHAGQSDLARVGWLFSAMFLPAANIMAFGGVVSYAYGGPQGMMRFLVSMSEPLTRLSGAS